MMKMNNSKHVNLFFEMYLYYSVKNDFDKIMESVNGYVTPI